MRKQHIATAMGKREKCKLIRLYLETMNYDSKRLHQKMAKVGNS